jgi:hypothetical protein
MQCMFQWNSASDPTLILSTSERTVNYFTSSWWSDIQFAKFSRWSIPGFIRWRQCSKTLALAGSNTRSGNYFVWWTCKGKWENRENIKLKIFVLYLDKFAAVDMASNSSFFYICINIHSRSRYMLYIHFLSIVISKRYTYNWGQLVEVLRYKPEGCGFDSTCCHWNFLLA